MSATNWAKCPQCEVQDALREDYEVFFTSREPGKFIVSYGGTCFGNTPDGGSPHLNRGCGFTFNYRHEEKVLLEAVCKCGSIPAVPRDTGGLQNIGPPICLVHPGLGLGFPVEGNDG